MTKIERTAQLRQIMAKHKLNAPAVGKLLRRSAQTVRSWACQNDERAIPEHMLELLNSKVAAAGDQSEQT